jgi:hypothetical protein
MAEWTESGFCNEGIIPKLPWLVYCDEVWGSARDGAAAVMISPSRIKLRYAPRLQFTNEGDKCMDNIIEYEAILLGFIN